MLIPDSQAVIAVFLMSLAALGAGSLLFDALPLKFGRAEHAGFGLLCGLGILSLSLFLVGQFVFTRMTIIAVSGCWLLLGVRAVFRLAQTARSWWPQRDQIPKVPAIIVLSVLSLTAVAGLAEVTGDLSSDQVAYHLLGPKVWLRDGLIRPVLDNCHTAFPQTAETFFAALLAVGNQRAPGLSSVLTFGLLLFVTASLAKRCGLNTSRAWQAAAIVAAMPAVYGGSHSSFIDGIYASFVLAALRVGLDAKRLREWAVFGLLCGLAMGTKYTGILAFPVLILCVALVRIGAGKTNWMELARNVGVAGFMACAIALPYYVRNWIVLGCPLYPPPPGYAHFCSPRYLYADSIAQFHDYIRIRGAGLGRGVLPFLLLPFNLTYYTSNFHGAGGIGLCPLALGPIGIIASRKSSIARIMALFGFLYIAAWYLTQQESRFLIPVYVISAIFAVIGWQHVTSANRTISQLLVRSIVVVSLAYGLLIMGNTRAKDVQSVMSSRYAAERRTKEIPYFASFEYLNRELSVRKVLILDRSVPPYYLDKGYIKPVGQFGERTLPGGPDALQALAHVQDLGVSHVLDVSSETSGFQVEENTPGLILVFWSPGQRIYQVARAGY